MRISVFGILAAFCAGAVARPPYPRPPRIYNLAITWENYSPDGFTKQMMLINGQSPGPTLEFEQGDHAIVNIYNESPYNTTVHFHGLDMHGTPWSDGVPGVTQRPIQPGESFKHEFEITQYGSYWYHSHFPGQIEDGFYGPIVIHPRKCDPKPFELISKDKQVIRAMERAEREVRPLVLSDVSHMTSLEREELHATAQIEMSCYDSVVFNGKGSVNCIPEDLAAAHILPGQEALLGLIPGAKLTDKSCLPAEVLDAFSGFNGFPDKVPESVYHGCKPTKGSLEVIKAERSLTGKSTWIALDIISSLNYVNSVVSIDEHDMWVYAMDGSYVEPQKVQAIALENGSRFSVLVEIKECGDFKIRANAFSLPQMIIGHAMLSVTGPLGLEIGDHEESEAYIDLVGTPLSDDVVFFNVEESKPYPPDPIPEKADVTHILHMRLVGSSVEWAMNTTQMLPPVVATDPRLPMLFDPRPNGEDNVILSTKSDYWVDLILFGAVVGMPPHPIHKHGNKMYRIGAGSGPFKWNSVEEAYKESPELFNLVDPPRKDSFSSPPTDLEVAWTAVRYHVDNPGPWLLHCHIDNHLGGGMMMVIQDGPEAWPEIPQYYLDKAGA